MKYRLQSSLRIFFRQEKGRRLHPTPLFPGYLPESMGSIQNQKWECVKENCMQLGKNSHSFPRRDTIIIYACQWDSRTGESGGWTQTGETGQRQALFCHSLGSDKGWNKEVFKVERWEEKQGVKEGQGLSSPRSHSITERTRAAAGVLRLDRELRTLYLERGEFQGFSFNLWSDAKAPHLLWRIQNSLKARVCGDTPTAPAQAVSRTHSQRPCLREGQKHRVWGLCPCCPGPREGVETRHGDPIQKWTSVWPCGTLLWEREKGACPKRVTFLHLEGSWAFASSRNHNGKGSQ